MSFYGDFSNFIGRLRTKRPFADIHPPEMSYLCTVTESQ